MYGLHYLENVLYFCVSGELKHLQRRWNCPFILEDLLFSGLTANQCMGKYIFLLQQWKKDSVQRIARNKNISNRTRVLSFQEPCYTSNGALQNDLCDPLRLLGLPQIYTSLTRLFELNMDFRGEVWEKDLYDHKRKKKTNIFSYVFSPFLGALLRSNSAENCLKDCVGTAIDYSKQMMQITLALMLWLGRC